MRVELTRPYGHYPLKVACLPIPPPGLIKSPLRAKNGARTRDPDLGKVVLYQLSYFRILRYKFSCDLICFNVLGAKNGARTRDPDLGKVVLYQLSYFRILFGFNVRYNSSFLELRCKGTIFFSPMQIFNRYF